MLGYTALVIIGALALSVGVQNADLERARDRQDGAALDKLIGQYQQTAQAKQNSAEAQYRLAIAYSYASEIAMELHDKRKAESQAEAGIDAAKRALAVTGSNAEYHRVLGELCAQVIPAAGIFGGLKYGQCARDEIEKAIQLDGKLALAYVSRGVGNYYLPPQFGGSPDNALHDIDKAISLDPKLVDAYIWKGVILRKLNRNTEAREALEKALMINPNRLWAKQQLDKTPAR